MAWQVRERVLIAVPRRRDGDGSWHGVEDLGCRVRRPGLVPHALGYIKGLKGYTASWLASWVLASPFHQLITVEGQKEEAAEKRSVVPDEGPCRSVLDVAIELQVPRD
jgi:hypothetical protein